jgi:hypothetical protein
METKHFEPKLSLEALSLEGGEDIKKDYYTQLLSRSLPLS